MNPSHPSYNIFKNLKKYFFPEYFFCFGNNEKKIFTSNNNYIDNNHVFPIGNMYIDYIKEYYKPSKRISKRFINLRKKYNKII